MMTPLHIGIASNIRFAICIGSMNEIVPAFLQNCKGTLLVSLEAGEVQSRVVVLVHVVQLQVFRGD